MNPFVRLTTWLESRWVAPAYSGWLLLTLAIFFFGAATNTLSGWLYVLSGVILALLIINAVLAIQTLKGIEVLRSHIEPVSVGELLTWELTLSNTTQRSKTLLLVQEQIPFVLGKPIPAVVQILPRQQEWRWVIEQGTQRRGIYRWQTLNLRTAAPLGLLWCQRSQSLPAKAVVYPEVLPLSQCPILDEMGRTQEPLFTSRDRNSTSATEGMTRSLRPYRWGDSTRLIHWRTSARYGNLQIRELETFTGGPEMVIALDSAAVWSEPAFEQAVVAAASLYQYASRQGYTVSLWTAESGLHRTPHAILEVLAGISWSEESLATLPQQACLWLSNNANQTASLPSQSRWILWHDVATLAKCTEPSPSIAQSQAHLDGLWIDPSQSLASQLQNSGSTYTP